MSRLTQRSVSTLVVLLCAIALASCAKASGGGWMLSATGSGKATFGFSGKCKDSTVDGVPTAKITAQLEYNDAPAGVRLHGIVSDTTFPGETCAQVQAAWDTPGSSTFSGIYRPQSGGEEGRFFVTLTDAGNPGLKGDQFSLLLLGGDYDGYSNTAPLGGGNIKVR